MFSFLANVPIVTTTSYEHMKYKSKYKKLVFVCKSAKESMNLVKVSDSLRFSKTGSISASHGMCYTERLVVGWLGIG